MPSSRSASTHTVEDPNHQRGGPKRGPVSIKISLPLHLSTRGLIPPPASRRDETRRDETKMHCVNLLGQRLMCPDFGRQVAGLQVLIAVLNGYISLGIFFAEPMGGVRPKKGNPGIQPICPAGAITPKLASRLSLASLRGDAKIFLSIVSNAAI